jgi:hypothetical protein
MEIKNAESGTLAGYNMDVDFKNLSPKREEALRQILSQCGYLNGAMKYNLSESVIRSVAEDLSRHYADLVKK